jgi:hypothetical protein
VNSRQRNRIQKKVSEHHRKARKHAKQSSQWKSKKPKDLGIPNAFPFKEQVLAEREELRRRRQEEKRQKRTGEESESVGNLSAHRADGNGNGTGSEYVAGLQIDSEEDDEILDEDMSEDEESGEEEFENGDEDDSFEEEEGEEGDDDDEDEVMQGVESSDSEWEGIDSDEDVSDIDHLTQTNTARNSKKPDYIRAILRADLVLFVLDARAIDLTRSPDIERYAKNKAKQSFFVLNRAGTIMKYPNMSNM